MSSCCSLISLQRSRVNTVAKTYETLARCSPTSIRCRWQTRATQCLAPTVLYTDVLNWLPTPCPVYHTDHPTKLTVPETISRSRDMVGIHQNLNGSRDLTSPLSGMFCHPWASSLVSSWHSWRQPRISDCLSWIFVESGKNNAQIRVNTLYIRRTFYGICCQRLTASSIKWRSTNYVLINEHRLMIAHLIF